MVQKTVVRDFPLNKSIGDHQRISLPVISEIRKNTSIEPKYVIDDTSLDNMSVSSYHLD